MTKVTTGRMVYVTGECLCDARDRLATTPAEGVEWRLNRWPCRTKAEAKKWVAALRRNPSVRALRIEP